MKKLKKALAVFLCVVLTLTAAPLSGFVGLELPDGSGIRKFAEGIVSAFDSFSTRAQAATNSGTCGDNLTWTFDTETGVLRISGTGAMTNWDFQKDLEAPWDNYTVTSVIIEDGVTTIGDEAFFHNSSITSVIMADSVTTIGKSAFDYCHNLTDLSIGNGVTTINDEAFISCSDLTEITIPKNVTYIGKRAFADCYSLEKIAVDAENQYFTADSDGVLYSRDMTRLLQYPIASTKPSYTIPEGVRSIDNEAFAFCDNITNVTLPDSLKAIGEYVFVDCYTMSSITIPAGIETIGQYAFGWYALPYYNGTLEQWKAVETDPSDTSIAKRVIICGGTDRPYYIPGTCGNEVNWTLYADGELVISGNGAMTNFKAENNYPTDNPWYSMCSKIKSITVEEGVTSIGNYAFYDCSEVKKVTLADTVSNIGSYAFRNCLNIDEFTIPVSAKATSKNSFYGINVVKKVTLTKGSGVMTSYSQDSGNSNYYGNTPWNRSAMLKEIVIEDGVTSIGSYAFNSVTYLKSIRIPATVTQINIGAFDECTDLTDIYYNSTEDDWNNILVSSENEPLTAATLHTATASGTCGDNLNWVLYNTGRLEINGTGAMTDWTAANKIPWFDYRTAINEIIIGEGVTSVGKYAFFSCTAKKSVTIPESIVSIAINAFGNSQSITVIHYASDKSDLEKISVGNGNNALTYASYNYGRIRLVDSGYFSEFEQWELYTDGELYVVGEGGMSNFTSAEAYPWHKHRDKITSFTIETYPNYLYPEMTNIGNHALEGCVNLKFVNFNNDITRIGDYAFAGCTSLESIVIPDTVTTIGDGAFYGCSGLKDLTMPVSAKIYNSPNVFYGCTGINKITLTKGNGTMVTYGTDTAVSSPTVNFKYTPWYISTSQIDLTIEDGITAISPYAFYGSKGITNVTISEGVTTIGEYAFCGNTTLKNVTIPESINTIGSYSFYQCSALENTYYAGDVSKWCKISFVDAYATPMSYADDLYFGGELVTELTIPAHITSINDFAFYGCSNITDVYYEGTSKQWSEVTVGIGNDVLFNNFKGGDSDNPFYAAGTCGNNLDWVLYTSGELVIIGSGAMNNYSTSTCAPWYTYRESIKYVTLPEGLTAIGSYAFYNCTMLESVVIPDGATSIGNYAFYGCAGMKELTVPISAKVTGTPNYTFYSCQNIDKITITKGDGTACNYTVSNSAPDTYYAYTPWYISGCSTIVIEDGVTSIGSFMFYRCTELTNITIPDSVTSVGDSAFYYCIGLEELTMPVSAKIYNSSETFLSCTNIKTITLTKGNGNAQKYTSSSYYSESTYYQYTPWYISQCGTIVIDKGVTSLGYYTFYGCNRIKDVYCTGDITDWCNINFDDSYANPMHSGDNLYFGGELVTEITIPTTVTKIGSYAFNTCSYLTAAYFNGTPEQWYAINVGTGNSALTDIITFSSGDRHYYAPGICGANLKWILYTDGELEIMGTGDMNAWTSTSNVPWYKHKGKITSVKISDGVTSIGGYAFYGCLNISGINLPDSITRIGTNAFFGCTGLTVIKLSKNLTNIDKAAFSGCLNLAVARCEMTYDRWAKVTVQADNQCLTDAILLGTASEKPYLAAGKINDNVTWYLYEDNELYLTGEGNMVNYASSSNSPWYNRRDKIKTVVVSDGITGIGKNAFAECDNVNKVYIYGYDVSIANSAFAECYDVNIHCYSGSSAHAYAKRNGLTYTLLDGQSAGFTVANDMVTAYSGDSTSPVIPSGTTAIGSYAFMNNSTITSIVLPNTVTDIYTGAFAGCENLERIVIPESVTTIASTAFNDTDVIFACVENSYAHIYALEHGIECELTSPEKGIELTSKNAYITVNGTTQLSVVVTSGSKSVIWSSSDSSVASVDSNGFVTGKKAGVVVITATTSDGIYKDYCLVRVVGITASYNTTTVVDPEEGLIYGLDVGLNSLTDYVELTDSSCTLEYDTLTDEIGTGTITNVVRDGEIVDVYTVVIFGDVDGNGWYDANDAFIVNMIASGLIDESRLSEAERTAADCNHDGVIDGADFHLLNQASLLLDDVDQSATQPELVTNSVYIAYCSLIDQTAGEETNLVPMPDLDEAPSEFEQNGNTENKSADEINFEIIFTTIFDFIKRIFSLVLSFIVK